jgi:tetratricopeptide (TPR) repeat protein
MKDAMAMQGKFKGKFQGKGGGGEALAAERLAKEKAEKRLAQIEKANQELVKLFTDLDGSKDLKEEPLAAQLSDKVNKAAAQLEGDEQADPVITAQLQMTLADAQLQLGYPQRAALLAHKANKAFADELGPDHPLTLQSMQTLAVCHEHTKDWTKAEALWREVLAAYRKPGQELLPQADALLGLGRVLLQQKKYDDAATTLREGIDLRVQLKVESWSTFEAKSQLGAALLGLQKYTDAEPWLQSGYDGLKQHAAKLPGAAKVRLVEAAQRLVDLYQAWDRPEEAARWRKTVEVERAKLTGKAPNNP